MVVLLYKINKIMKTKKIDLNTLGAKLRRAKLAAGLSLSLAPSTIVHKDKRREASKRACRLRCYKED